MPKKLARKLHQPPHPTLEYYALLFFSIAVVFTMFSFISPWRGAYEQTASAAVPFSSIYTQSVYQLGNQSSAVAQSELNIPIVWDAWINYLAGVMYPASN